MKYVQVQLVADDTGMICWVKNDPRLAEGKQLTLKEFPDVTWTITALYSDNLQEENQRRTWRVGGIQ